MKLPLFFRLLVTSSILFTFASVVVAVILQNHLPPPLKQYLDDQYSSGLTISDIASLALTFLLLATLFITYIGLYNFKGWARILFAFLLIPEFALSISFGPFVHHGFDYALETLATITAGMIIAMSFWSPIAVEFEQT